MLYSNQKKTRSGFTIVELLIAIAVIATLAALAIVSYNGVTRSAVEVSMKSDLKRAAATLELDYKKNKQYPATAEEANGGKGLAASGESTFIYKLQSTGYCMAIASPKTDKVFQQTSNGKIQEGECPIVTTAIEAGRHTCAIADDRAYCWGSGANGRLGNGTTRQNQTPVAVDTSGVLSGKRVTAITTGAHHSCALADGQVYCWGLGANGQLGNGLTTSSQTTPVAVDTSGVLSGKRVTAITAGGWHTCAIAEGQVYCWGEGTSGRLGGGYMTTSQTTPIAVDTSGALSGKAVSSISGGGTHTCAVANGQAYCWGANGNGQLGSGTTSTRYSPVAVSTPGTLAGVTVSAITAGWQHSCALANGQAYCWGIGSGGALGDGSALQQTSPVAVSTSGVLSGKSVAAIAAGDNYTCALADKRVYCWGANGNGQLGNGSVGGSQATPVAVSTSGVLSGKNVATITAGDSHACVIAESRTYCWGAGEAGRLGAGAVTSQSSPIAVSPFPEL